MPSCVRSGFSHFEMILSASATQRHVGERARTHKRGHMHDIQRHEGLGEKFTPPHSQLLHIPHRCFSAQDNQVKTNLLFNKVAPPRVHSPILLAAPSTWRCPSRRRAPWCRRCRKGTRGGPAARSPRPDLRRCSTARRSCTTKCPP